MYIYIICIYKYIYISLYAFCMYISLYASLRTFSLVSSLLCFITGVIASCNMFSTRSIRSLYYDTTFAFISSYHTYV